jgi:uncharacterized protein involved in exopolysaccharide biosynthesis
MARPWLLGVLGAVYCAVSTRRYEATGTVQIEKESSDGLGLDILMNEATIDPMRFKPTTLSMFHSAI